MKLLEGKTAVITGAARGIGKEIALKYASEGCNIAFTDLVIDENGKKTEEDPNGYIFVRYVKRKDSKIIWPRKGSVPRIPCSSLKSMA